MNRSGASRRLDAQPSILDRSDPHVLTEQLRGVTSALPADLPHRDPYWHVRLSEETSQFLSAEHRQER